MSSTPRKATNTTSAGETPAKNAGGPAPSTTPAEIQREIEHTHEQLGGTAEALPRKADMSARVKDKVHTMTETMQARSEEVKHQVQDGVQALVSKADDVGGQAKAMSQQALDTLPPPVHERVERVVTAMRRRTVPTVAIVAAVLLVRRLLRRARQR